MIGSLGHHLDHVVRGNHVGWPLTSEITPFTASLAVYPLVIIGLVLERSGRVGAAYWLFLSGPGALFLSAVHLGPTALEPPSDIIDHHGSTAVGWFAFAWLLALLASLVVAFAYEWRLWREERRSPTAGDEALVQSG